jgi:peptide/nickel transport system permease protein
VTAYFVRRVLLVVPTLIGITLLAFAGLRVAGGDAALMLAGQDKSPAVVEQIRREFGLDKPVPEQYLVFVVGLTHGDFGRSFTTRRPVGDEIARRYPRTLVLASASIVFALVAGVSLGIIASIRPYSLTDNASMLAALVGLSVPGFWLGLMLIYLFSVHWRLLPTIGLETPMHLILPVVVMSAYTLASTARMTRASMLDVLGNDYVRTARAKGLGERGVVLGHALKNALMPVLTLAAISFGYMLGGSVVTETIFSIDGIGSMVVDGILARDAPVVQAAVIVLAVNFVVITLGLDLVYAYLDPRIRY